MIQKCDLTYFENMELPILRRILHMAIKDGNIGFITRLINFSKVNAKQWIAIISALRSHRFKNPSRKNTQLFRSIIDDHRFSLYANKIKTIMKEDKQTRIGYYWSSFIHSVYRNDDLWSYCFIYRRKLIDPRWKGLYGSRIDTGGTCTDIHIHIITRHIPWIIREFLTMHLCPCSFIFFIYKIAITYDNDIIEEILKHATSDLLLSLVDRHFDLVENNRFCSYTNREIMPPDACDLLIRFIESLFSSSDAKKLLCAEWNQSIGKHLYFESPSVMKSYMGKKLFPILKQKTSMKTTPS
jgi:hypothetical protein